MAGHSDIQVHMTPIGLDTDPAHFMAMMEANIIGVQKNNEGNIARKRGDLARAEKLHKEALQLKIRGFGDESIQAAISFNTLGVTYLKMGPSKLDQAEDNLKKALRIRDYRASGGLERGSAQDAAVTRDNMAQVLEARGKMAEAREMRLRGAKKNEIVCGCVECITPGGKMLPLQKLKQCDGCKAVFYCHPTCQQKDWSTRHKSFCEAYVAAKNSADGIEAISAS